MQVTKGIDTIMGLVGVPPNEIKISRDVLLAGTRLLKYWNSCFLAFIPYCYMCKSPVDWVQGDKSTAFICPMCNRKWVLDEEVPK